MIHNPSDFELAERALFADPNRGTPSYDRAVHAIYIKAYEARERAIACAFYSDPDVNGPCTTCGVASYYHRFGRNGPR